MRATIYPGRDFHSWFDGPVSPLQIRYLKDTAIFVTHPSDIKEWLLPQVDDSMAGRAGDLMRTLLESIITVGMGPEFREESDFRLSGKPGELNSVLESSAYEERLTWRTASPFLEGEDSSGAFYRLFGDLIPHAQDWQVIDQFLLEQLMKQEPVWDFLAQHVGSFPPTVEIFSRSPHYDLRESEEGKSSLRKLEELFRANGKRLVIKSFFPGGTNVRIRFPHPRLQKVRFKRGEIFSSLDNGLNSLVLDGPSVFSVATAQDWTRAQGKLGLMVARTLSQAR
jgi:hypothetical protein